MIFIADILYSDLVCFLFSSSAYYISNIEWWGTSFSVIVLSMFVFILLSVIVWLLVKILRLNREIDHQNARFELLDFGSKTSALMTADDFIITNQDSLAQILDRIPYSIFIKNDENRFYFANSAFQDSFGISRLKMLGKTAQELGGVESEFRKFRPLRERTKVSEVFVPAYLINTPKGNKLSMSLLKVLLKGAGQETLFTIGFDNQVFKETRPVSYAQGIKLNIRTLLENLDGMAYRCKTDEFWTMEYISPSCQRITGYSQDEIIDNRVLPYSELIVDEDRDIVSRAIHGALARDTRFEIEYRIKRKDGEIRWVYEQGICVNDLGQTDSVLEGYVVDISKMKQATVELQKTKDRRKVALAGANCGVWDWNIKDKKLYLSDEWQKMLNCERADLPTNSSDFMKLIHSDDHDKIKDYLDEVLNTGIEKFSFDERVKTQDGDWIWLSVHANIVDWDENDKPLRAVGISYDVTEQKLNEQRVQKRLEYLTQNKEASSEYEFKDIFDFTILKEIQEVIAENLNVNSTIIDMDGKTILESPVETRFCERAIELAQLKAQMCTLNKTIIQADLEDKPVLNRCAVLDVLEAVIPIKVGDKHVANWILGYVADEETDENKALNFAKKNNLDIEVLKTEFSRIVHMPQSQFLMISELVHLLSKQWSKLMASNLDQAKEIISRELSEEELRLKNKELEDIIYVSSHDLRAPLVNIQGFSLELKRSCEDLKKMLEDAFPGQQREDILRVIREDMPEYVEFINASINKMDMLQKGLLQISRLGKVKLDIKEISTKSLVSDVLRALEYQIRDRKAIVNVTELPDCIGDWPTLHQVFSNILENSLKYLDESRQGRISVSGQEKDGKVIYCFEDNGIGIPKEELENVFGLFYRVGSKEEGTGDGLGLSLVQRIVSRHKGKVWAESEEGQWTKIFVELHQKNEN